MDKWKPTIPKDLGPRSEPCQSCADLRSENERLHEQVGIMHKIIQRDFEQEEARLKEARCAGMKEAAAIARRWITTYLGTPTFPTDPGHGIADAIEAEAEK
jgi:hypothetical protein